VAEPKEAGIGRECCVYGRASCRAGDFLRGWSASSFADLTQTGALKRRWLITADKGFADLREHPPGTTPT